MPPRAAHASLAPRPIATQWIGAGSHRLLASTTPEKLPGGLRQKLAEQRTWSMLRRSAVVRAQAPRQFSRSAHLKMLLERTWHLSAPRDRTRSAQVNRAGCGAWRILQSERVGFPRSNRTLARGCAAGEKNAALFYTMKSGIFIRSFDEFVPKTCKLLRFGRGPARRRAAADRQHIATQAAAAPKTVRDRSAAKRTVI